MLSLRELPPKSATLCPREMQLTYRAGRRTYPCVRRLRSGPLVVRWGGRLPQQLPLDV